MRKNNLQSNGLQVIGTTARAGSLFLTMVFFPFVLPKLSKNNILSL